MEGKDWMDFHRETDCHICQKSLFRYNTKGKIEFWHPETGEYCVRWDNSQKHPEAEAAATQKC